MRGDADLLTALWVELQKGRVYECSLRSDTMQVHGLQDGPTIFIDPRKLIIETVLHECCHRLMPDWSEARVERTAKRLLLTMDEAAVQKWHRGYRRIRKPARPVEVED